MSMVVLPSNRLQYTETLGAIVPAADIWSGNMLVNNILEYNDKKRRGN